MQSLRRSLAVKAFPHWGYLKFWAVIIFLGDHDSDNILWLVHFRYAMFSINTVVLFFSKPLPSFSEPTLFE